MTGDLVAEPAKARGREAPPGLRVEAAEILVGDLPGAEPILNALGAAGPEAEALVDVLPGGSRGCERAVEIEEDGAEGLPRGAA
ncbi:MAG: hypothetical protein HY049_12435 [Acidobacteria bacterium]|nr:hypothetical protein [Acidobacteriota bacterium]